MLAVPLLSLMMVTAAQDLPARLKADAQDARQQLAVVFVRVGDTFQKIGQEVKEGGVAVGHAARTAGQEVGQGAKQVGADVKKRAKRLGQGVKEAFTPEP